MAHAPAPEASQVEEEDAFDDVEVEREEDEAHFAAFEAERREREAAEVEPEAELFPEESEPDRFVHVQDTDLPLTTPPATRAEPAPPRPSYQPAPSPRPERAAAPAGLRGDFLRAPDPSETEVREGTRMLPLAVTLMVGLLLGFIAGYLVGGRDRQPPPSTTASVPTEAPTSAAAGQQPSGGREFSEQVVAPSGARGTPGRQPSNATPPVPGDRARESDTASARPAAPVRGKLIVQSSPSRANVTVNGQWRGRTPLELENLPWGPYNVRVVQPGFDVAREQVTLSASQAARTVSFKLQPTRRARAEAPEPLSSPNGTGVLFVDSRPRGAQVFVDGRLVGTTPLRVADIAIGSHVVRLELKGHSRWTTSTTISSGREARVTGSLDPIP